jgi:hypothetical protein
MSAELKPAPAVESEFNERNTRTSNERSVRLLIVLGAWLLIAGALLFGMLESGRAQSQSNTALNRADVRTLPNTPR